MVGSQYGLTMIAYIAGIIFLFVLGRFFLEPVKIIMKVLAKIVIGGIFLLIINFIGGTFNFSISVNLLSALIAGFLGIPGIILLIILRSLLYT